MTNQNTDPNNEQTAPTRVRPYSPEEIRRLLALPSCPVLVVTALYTGMRQGELRNLIWSDVRLDLEPTQMQVRYRVSGAGRTVPIHPELLPVLQSWQRDCPYSGEGRVFRFDSGGRWIRDLLTRAGITTPARPFHAFCHSLAVHMMDGCQDQRAVSAMLGHRSGASRAEREVTRPPSVVSIYQALSKMTFRSAS